MFLYTFLRLGRWNSFFRALMLIWIVGQLSIVAGAVLDPRLAATLARTSFLLLAGLGSTFILLLSLRGHDRALAMLPSWLIFLVWLFAAALTAIGRLNGDIVNAGLVSGLVLIVLIIGFTVTQFAFRSFEPVYVGSQNDMQLRSMAIDAAGASMWEWSSRRDEVKTGQLVEESLALKAGDLSTRVDEWVKHLHIGDREKFRLALWSLQQKNGGSLQTDLRLRHADGSYRWFELRAETTPSSDQRSLRLIGLLRDVTNTRRAHERLVQDAVIDNLTGLPNRELFLDRLSVAMVNAREDAARPELLRRPTVIVVDVDRFKDVNASFGLIVGDSLLLTLARRLSRHIGAIDTLARLGGDQFAVIVLSEQDPRDIAGLAERIRRAIRSPMKIAGKDVAMTGSIGIAVFDGSQEHQQQLLAEAEAAMLKAKRAGSDRIELFKAEMHNSEDSARLTIAELAKAIDRKTISIHYEPIMRLANDDVVGFEAIVALEHPRLGALALGELMPIAERGELVSRLIELLMDRSLKDVARWQRELPRPDTPLYVTLNLSSRQLFRPELVQELRQLLGRETAAKGSFRLAIDERLVLENPERALDVLDGLKSSGLTLVLDDFGDGYTSLGDLARFGFDVVRLNHRLVERAGYDATSATLVKSTIALVRELGCTVAARGVDTPDIAVLLRGSGCEQAQGYHCGPPMNEREITELLAVIRKEDRRNDRRGSILPKMLSRVVDSARGRGGEASEPGKSAATKAEREKPEAATGGAAARPGAAGGKTASGRNGPGRVGTLRSPPGKTAGGRAAVAADSSNPQGVRGEDHRKPLGAAEVRQFPVGGRGAVGRQRQPGRGAVVDGGGDRSRQSAVASAPAELRVRPEPGAKEVNQREAARSGGRVAAAGEPFGAIDLGAPMAATALAADAPVDGKANGGAVEQVMGVLRGELAVGGIADAASPSIGEAKAANAGHWPSSPEQSIAAAVDVDVAAVEQLQPRLENAASPFDGTLEEAASLGSRLSAVAAPQPVATDNESDELSRLSAHIRGMLTAEIAPDLGSREPASNGLASFRRRVSTPSADAGAHDQPGGDGSAATQRFNGFPDAVDHGGEQAPGAVVKSLFARFSRPQREPGDEPHGNHPQSSGDVEDGAEGGFAGMPLDRPRRPDGD